MQRSAWIFLSAILLPSLGLAWLAIHSVRDQQVVVQHQEAIICQNLTDGLAKNIQDQMDHVRQDFVRTTRQLLTDSTSPESLAGDFNHRLHPVWSLAEIGFAVDLDGQIYSPQPRDGLSARKFRDENDRFLSNRENAEVYFSNGLNSSSGLVMQAGQGQSAPAQAAAVPMGGSTVTVTSTTGLFNSYRHDESENASPAPASGPQSSPTNEAQPSLPQDQQKEFVTRDLDKTADTDQGTIHAKAAATPAAQPAPAPSAPGNDFNLRDTTEAAKSKDTVQQEMQKKAPASPQHQLEEGRDKTASAPTTTAASDLLTLSTPSAPTSNGNTPVPPATTSPAAAATSRQDSLRREMPAPVESKKQSRAGQITSGDAQGAMGTVNANSSASDAAQPAPDAAAATLAPTSSLNAAKALNNTVQQVLKIQRNVVPQQQLVATDTVSFSNTVPAESDFRQVIGSETSGSLARFLENKLCLMVWSHTPVDSPIIFGAQLDPARLAELLKTSFQNPDITAGGLSDERNSNYCLAILDDSGHPVALSRTGFKADWKHPFVATELGEALPHWEAALYLMDPQQIDRTARTLQFTLGLIVLLLVAAIVAGGSLIATDVRRQVRLAQQKTDFVSNVSHELKTPLTSIRMFADLLAEKRVPDEQKQSTYLRIIAAEAARLTRLINNVLDFARLERGAPPGEHHACDLVDAVRDVIETCQPHLETSGIAFHSEIETEKLSMVGDRDALAQIILNLVSNAEKYGGNDVTVRVRRQETSAGALGCVDVLDRGAGISPRDMKTIFEPFHRLDDSLASGIPGSGLGLTLSRRMARAHGGDVTCSARAGGGTCFTLSVPLTPSKS